MIDVHESPGLGPGMSPAGTRLLAAIALQERVAAALEPLLAELVRSIPRLRAWRRFSSGAWVMGVRTAAETAGDPVGRFARLDFELRTDAVAGSVELTSRSTVRSRDRAAQVLAVRLDDLGEAELRRWSEREALDFAAAYWGRPAGQDFVPAETGAS